MQNIPENRNPAFSLPRTTAYDLMGKQSVRATFRLSEVCIDAISILAAQLGIKQKSLFDHLMEDVASLSSIARRADLSKLNRTGRIQKTFVISRKSLSCLDAVSKKFGAPRDDLVEYSIQRLLPIIANERRKQEKRQRLLVKISAHFNAAMQLLDETKRLLSQEDPIYKSLAAVFAAYKNAYATIEAFVQKGKRIEKFPVEKF